MTSRSLRHHRSGNDRQEGEVWLPIAGYENAYEVSNQGRVRSLRSGGRVLKPWLACGYPMVHLCSGGEAVDHSIHRLVCWTFNGPPAEPHLLVAHLDGSRANNVPSNLCWATAAENESHKENHGTVQRGEARKAAKLTSAAVREIWSSRRSSREEAAARGVSKTTIIAIRAGRAWRHVTSSCPGQPHKDTSQ